MHSYEVSKYRLDLRRVLARGPRDGASRLIGESERLAKA